jgi:PhnB protein
VASLLGPGYHIAHQKEAQMSVIATAHINFRGNAREALAFYQSVFGGEIAIATYADIHAVETPIQAEQVAFGQVTAPNGFMLLAYDVQPSKAYNPGENAFYIRLQGTEAEEIKRLWDALAGGGTILTPLAPAAFAPLYGMLTDRFGVTWIVGVDSPHNN